jgi:hypothetical protein
MILTSVAARMALIVGGITFDRQFGGIRFDEVDGDVLFAYAKDEQEWQAAVEALLLVVTLGGPTMFARIGIMRALNRRVEPVFDPSRKDKHWGRRKLARDQ